MSEPIHLKICAACDTGIPEAAGVCPECGAPQGGAGPGRPEQKAGPDPVGVFFGTSAERRAGVGTLLRPWLGGNLGCILTLAVPVFGIPLLFGAMLGDPLGGLAIPLIGIASLGLVATTILIWLVWPGPGGERSGRRNP